MYLFNQIKIKSRRIKHISVGNRRGVHCTKEENRSNLSSKDVLNFPELTKRDLKILFEFSQSVFYVTEMINNENNINLQHLVEKPNILKLKIKSRHVNKKVHSIIR